MEDDVSKSRYELRECSCLPYYYAEYEKRYLKYRKNHQNLSWEEIITFVDLELDREFYTGITEIEEPGQMTVLVNKYRQLPANYAPEDLETIKPEFNEGALLLRNEARLAFEVMCMDALRQGISLKAISTYRSYTYQKQVYYKNWQQALALELPYAVTLELYQKERDKVSARAGFSEHQTGLAVDINDLEQSFEGTPEGMWLKEHAYRYGFLLRYPKGKEWITGYDFEPWHYRYLGTQLAKEVFDSGLTYDEFYIRHLAPRSSIGSTK